MFKQKTAYEMRISDWSSDVCSSDLVGAGQAEVGGCPQIAGAIMQQCADRVAGQRRGHRRVVLDPLQRSVAGAISQHAAPDGSGPPRARPGPPEIRPGGLTGYFAVAARTAGWLGGSREFHTGD